MPCSRARSFLHPGPQVLVGHVDVEKLVPGHKVALHIVHATLDLAFVPRCVWPGGADQKAIVLGHAPVGFAQHRIVDQGLDHRSFEVVRHDPLGHAAPALEGAPVQPNPGRHFLVKDQLGILVTAVAQGGDKDVGRAQSTAGRVVQLTHRAKVHLHLFARGGVHAHKHLRCSGPQLPYKTPHRRVAALVVIVVLQTLPDGHHLDPLFQQPLHDLPVRLHARGHARRVGRLAQRGRQRGLIRQRAGPLPGSLALPPTPVLVHRRARQAQILGNASLALAARKR